MKTLNKLFSIGALAFLLMLMAPHKSMAQDGGYVSDQEFYDELQQYGTWVQDDEYGDVWVPDVDGDFRPYATNGYWVQTDYGTTWVSDYPWGWATFHYGRWRYDDYYGWEWLPGHEWAPAWVSWRQGGGYYGWAPMGPGISITLSLGGGGAYVNNNYWVYAPQRYINSRYISRYYAPRAQVGVIIRNTTYIRNTYVYNNRTYITGPRAADIQKITRQRVTVYKINNANRPGAFHTDKNVINIYRPDVKKSPDARPGRVVGATAYRNEYPTEGIGKKGVTGYNRGNAAKLAATVRADNPNSNVVKVNPRKPEPNEPNKPNEPAVNGHHTAPAGNRTTEPKTNTPPATEPRTGNERHKPAVTQPEQQATQQPAVNRPVEPQNNAPAAQPAPTTVGQGGHHHRSVPAVMPAEQHNANQVQQQQAKEQAQQHPAANRPVEPQSNAPVAQPTPTTVGQGGHHHRSTPAVVPTEQHNANQVQQQAQKEQQLQQQQQQAKQEAQQQQERQAALQQQKQQQQQAQQAARQQAQQQVRQEAQQQAQQQRQQQQAQQQAARQAAQQQKQQQQQAQQQAQQAARQAAQKQQEEQQKQQQQTPPEK